MNIILQFVMHIYAALLRLYPRAFRDEFAAEMKNVFEEQVAEAAAHGRLALTALCLREVRDLPLAILYEHWLGLVEADMDSLIGINNPQILFDDRPSPGSKREAALAALPHLLVTVLILPELLTGLGLVPPITGTWAGNALLFGFALSILGVFILAWRQHFPRWFASWYGYIFLLLALVLAAGLQGLGRQSRYDWGDAFLKIATPTVLAWLLYQLVQRDRLAELLMVLPTVILLWVPMLEFVSLPFRGAILLGIWLLNAITAAAIVRVGSVRVAMWLVIGLDLFAGLAVAFAHTFLRVFPPEAGQRYPVGMTGLDWMSNLIPPLLATCTLIIGPLLAWALRQVGKRSGRIGEFGFRLAIAGMLLAVIGSFGSFWWYSSEANVGIGVLPNLARMSLSWFAATAYFGMLLYLGGMLVLGGAASRNNSLPGRGSFLLLVLIPLLLPLVALVPLLYNFQFIPVGIPFELWRLNDVLRVWVYVIGIAWLFLGSGLVMRLSGNGHSRT